MTVTPPSDFIQPSLYATTRRRHASYLIRLKPHINVRKYQYKRSQIGLVLNFYSISKNINIFTPQSQLFFTFTEDRYKSFSKYKGSKISLKKSEFRYFRKFGNNSEKNVIMLFFDFFDYTNYSDFSKIESHFEIPKKIGSKSEESESETFCSDPSD